MPIALRWSEISMHLFFCASARQVPQDRRSEAEPRARTILIPVKH